ncbi:replication factor C small subunit [Candidatus Woesearchaeota archaeon CG_4_10_14_0_8_um_filter_47_5]|nr:MAG: replication factor C small subunit [Candidatus Woesearchaeota archaeon CG_4_10_14_0_8_um_filter_47_5]
MEESAKEYAIWTEKYRPQSFSEIKGHKEIVKRVKAFVKNKNMPHLLFSGPAGVGKTTLALVIARQLFGDSWRDNFLELNASDERGIDVVREKVKNFARTRAIGDVPFKIIYLDESDSLTKDAQHALRRTMENYTRTCRFILSCNYSSKIIDPIQSRCVVFRFRRLSREDIFEKIGIIAEKESLSVSNDGKEALFVVSDGDCRKLENVMQSCAAVSPKITEEVVYSVASFAQPKEVEEIICRALQNEFIEARNSLLSVMFDHGLAGLDIIKQVQAKVSQLKIDARIQLKIIEKCGEIEFRMVEGSDEFIQLEALLAYIALVGSDQAENV